MPPRTPAPPIPALVCLLGLVAAPPVRAQAPASAAPDDLVHVPGLGSLAFPVTGAPEALPDFYRGVLLLHSFEYDAAAEAFRSARGTDPGFVMAYWGEAMTHTHPVWMEQDLGAARAVLGDLAPSRDARLAAAATGWERDWLEAVEVLYGEGPKEERDDRYADAMRALHERYPDDLEARAFYALSLLGTAHEGRDFATYMRAAAVAQPVADAIPEHPGALHYLIHSFDDPIHAPLGLPAARAYSDVAPDAAHAQHMTSHIFVAMGMWDDVILANQRASAVVNEAREAAGRTEAWCGHYPSWLQYGHVMRGEEDEAARILDGCLAQLRSDPGLPDLQGYYDAQHARYVVDTGSWDALERWPAREGSPTGRFVEAYAAWKQGDPGPARTLADELGDAEAASQPELLLLEVRGMIALAEGRGDDAIALLREAAELEASLPFEFGPPRLPKPTHELLGEVLLEVGRTDEAVEALETALARTPGRLPVLAALERAGGG